ncbi:hypothetical protein [Polaribacter sp. IC073]|uniref:hypothetical protein n=1 Tax=Polaribacter sp. IC073 TaxID=2508540 RepID=UPI0011BFD23E|nr:hypothetical protein [Polaribacter sp. IC073]TXD49708.1 hypothetical protein ES045_00540 [Polaribacter sp. IC073]
MKNYIYFVFFFFYFLSISSESINEQVSALKTDVSISETSNVYKILALGDLYTIRESGHYL